MLLFNKYYKKNTGYSLLEMVTVIGIIAITMVIAASMYTSFVKNRNLKEAAAELMSEMKLAKQRAAAESVPYQMTINKENNTYTVKDCCDAGCTSFGCAYNVTNNLGKYGSNVTFTDDITYSNITFQSRGTCTAGHVTLQNFLGSTIKITTSMTGRIRSEQILKK